MVRTSRRRAVALLGGSLILAAGAAASGDNSAVIADTAEGGGTAGGIFFVVEQIDGERVRNAVDNSLRASAGRGADLTIVGGERNAPARRVKLQLRATHTHAAPVLSIVRAIFRGPSPDVVGEIDVDLQPGRRYRVNGVLDVLRREVWLENALSGEIVGERIVLPPDPEIVKAMQGAGYTQTNLRYDGDWISDEPYPQLPLVPVGSRIKVVSFARHRAHVLIDGRKMRIGVDHGRDAETIEQMVARVSGPDDPRARIAAWPLDVRRAIGAGRVVPGMDKPQVVVALGRPRLDQTPLLEADEWRYALDNGEEVFLVFGSDGRLSQVDASRRGRSLLLLPEASAQAGAASAPSSDAPSAAGSAVTAPTSAGASAPAAASAPQ
jgi:hypothetical protein